MVSVESLAVPCGMKKVLGGLWVVQWKSILVREGLLGKEAHKRCSGCQLSKKGLGRRPTEGTGAERLENKRRAWKLRESC